MTNASSADPSTNSSVSSVSTPTDTTESAVRKRPRCIVLTGGPGAGKTAILGLVRAWSCPEVAVLPEAATLLFGGGFPRQSRPDARKASQRAIFHVQHELEAVAASDPQVQLIVCDRGTIDGLAYWPEDPASLWQDVHSSLEEELARYDMVIHLRTPPPHVYNYQNPIRTESPAEASELDRRVEEVWKNHPKRFVIDNAEEFWVKANRALSLIAEELPQQNLKARPWMMR